MNYAVLNKFMVNSRLYKVVKGKKKRKELEEQWLSRISPVGDYSTKTMSRISTAMRSQNGQNQHQIQSLNTNNKENKAPTKNNTVKTGNSLRSNNSNSAKCSNSVKANPLKSPSRCMSRGRRALLKAKREIKKTPTKKKVPNTPSVKVKGTPMVTAVNRIVRRLDYQQRVQTVQEADGHDADDDDDDDDDVVMNNDANDGNIGNNGSMEPRSPKNIETSFNHEDDTKDKENDLREINDLNQEMKEMTDLIGHESLDSEDKQQEEEDDAVQSDEMKIDDDPPPQSITGNKRNSFTLSLPMEIGDVVEDEDDDLELEQSNSLRTSKLEALFMGKAKTDSVDDDIHNLLHRNEVNQENQTFIKSSPSPLEQKGNTNHQNVQVNHQNVQINHSSVSPQAGSPVHCNQLLCIPESPQMTDPVQSTSKQNNRSNQSKSMMKSCRGVQVTMNEMNEMNSINGISDGMTRNNSNSSISISSVPSDSSLTVPIELSPVYSRSVGTQTERIQCSIGIQTVCPTVDNMNSFDDLSEFVVMKNKPTIIVTTSGNKYVRLHEPEMGQIAENEKISKSEKTGKSKNRNRCQRSKVTVSAATTNLNKTKKQNQEQKEEETVDVNYRNHSVDTDQLESLSLSLDTSNGGNTEKKRNRASRSKRRSLKRKYDSISPDAAAAKNEEANMSDDGGKRRRVMRQQSQRRRYQKKDIVWAMENEQREPVIIISCEYDGNEKWYPSRYELLWLRWVDNTNDNGRLGQCSVTTEPAEKVMDKVTDEEFKGLTKQFDDAAKTEIKRWRPDVYKVWNM